MKLQERLRERRQRWIAAGQWMEPNLTDCLDFMVTEVAEAVDKRLRSGEGYVRNNTKPLASRLEIGIEVFDAIMMGCIALDLLELDLEEVAEIKLQRMDEKRGLAESS